MKDKKFDIPVTINVVLTEEDVVDIIVTALNGGIGYWGCLDNTKPEFSEMKEDDCVDEFAAKIITEGGSITILDEEDYGEEYKVGLKELFDGIRLYCENGLDVDGVFGNGRPELGMFDAVSADFVIQLAVFGDVVYG